MTFRIEIPSADIAVLNNLAAEYPDLVTITKSRRFGGHPDLVQGVIIVVPIALKLISSIARIIEGQQKVDRYIEVEYDGFRLKIRNVKDMEGFLQKLVNNSQSKESTNSSTTGE